MSDRFTASRDGFVHASNTIAEVRDFLLIVEMALIQEGGDVLDDARKAIATLVSLCQVPYDRVIFGLPHRAWRPEMEILVYGADAGVADSGICQLRLQARAYGVTNSRSQPRSYESAAPRRYVARGYTLGWPTYPPSSPTQ